MLTSAIALSARAPRKALLVVGAALAAASLAACGSSDSDTAKPEELTTVRVVSAGGLKQGAYIWNLYAGIRQGFFKERGIRVAVTGVSNGALSVQALTANAVDEAGPISADSFIDAIDRGADITLAGLTNAAVGQFIVKNSIKSWDDLKGKRVGSSTPALTGSDIYMVQMLKAHGLDTSDVDITSLGASDAKVVAVQTGAVDAVMLSSPYSVSALATGKYHVLQRTWDSEETFWPFVGFGFSKKFESAHPELAKGFVAAMQEANTWLLEPDNKQKAIDMLVHYTDASPKVAEQTYEETISESKSVYADISVTDDKLRALLKALGKPINDETLARYRESSITARD